MGKGTPRTMAKIEAAVSPPMAVSEINAFTFAILSACGGSKYKRLFWTSLIVVKAVLFQDNFGAFH